jgi:predicted AlkP superfamily phosphohydrolase/phosphomutase
MKKLIWIVIAILLVVSAGWIGTSAYTAHRIQQAFPHERPVYPTGDVKRIQDGDELIVLRNPGSDLHIRIEGSKGWNSDPVRIQVGTETKEIGAETFSWPYFRKSFEVSAKRLDPDSFVRLKFETNEKASIQLTKFEARTNQVQPKILIFGFDGAGMSLLQPLMESGRCPNFKKLLQEGSYGDLLSEDPAYSPVIWTTVATGRPPSDHGITFYLARTQPETSTNIKVKRFWDIFSQYTKLNSLILGWYLTWPVEDLQGGLISDRAYYKSKARHLSFPPEVFDDHFQKVCTDVVSDIDQRLKRFTSFPFQWDWKKRYAAGTPEYLNSKIVHQRLLHVLRRDSSYAEFGLQMMTKLNPDVLALYLRGTDFTSHGFWKFRNPEQVPFMQVTQQEQVWFRDVIDKYYVYLDEVLGKYLALAGKDTTIFVLSDHGFQAISKEEGTNPELSGAHTLNGILFASGPHFKKGYQIQNASIYDFLPTLLYIAGLPQAEDMPGKVLTDAIVPEFIAKNPLKKIKTYGGRAGTEEKSSETLDEEIKEELRSLGYIQ